VLGSRRADECCVWVVSPVGYPHARGFDDCAAALAEGLGAALGGESGTVQVVHDPAHVGDRAAVIVGANLLASDTAFHVPTDSVLVNLEQLDAASRWFGDDYRTLLSRHAVVDYSARNTAALRRLGLDHVRHLRLGASPGLETLPAHRTDHVDVCFYGSLNARRIALLDELERRGLIVERLFGVYGQARDAAVARAKLVLNVHYYDAAVFEAVRVTHLLANGVCVVTEGDADDPDIAPLATGLAVGRYADLADRCEQLVADADARGALAEAGIAALQALPQADEWRRTLERTAEAPTIAARHTSPTDGATTSLERITILAPAGDMARCRSLAVAATELRALGLEVGAAVIDHAHQVSRRGWECTIQGGLPLADVDALDRFAHADGHLVLTADRLGATLLSLAPLRRALWWFSVDDLVGTGGPLADAALLTALGDDEGIDHYHHGAYVREFLRSRGIAARRLDDHLGPLPAAAGAPADTRVVIGPAGAAARRVAASVAALAPQILPDDPAAIDSHLESCAVYLHAGPLAGRDPLLRMAVAGGAIVFVPESGAGRYVEDVPVPDTHRYDAEAVETGALAERVRLAIAAPEASRRAQQPYRWAVEDERDAMVRQLTRLITSSG
jgi:hypothetical protein